jgi:hypothetical protein
MWRRYLHEQVFFLEIAGNWIVMFAPASGVTYGPPPSVKERDGKSFVYTALMLVLWVVAGLGGLAVALSMSAYQPLPIIVAVLGWGCGVAPVLVVGIMKALFPDFSRQLQSQIELDKELKRKSRQRELRKQQKKQK